MTGKIMYAGDLPDDCRLKTIQMTIAGFYGLFVSERVFAIVHMNDSEVVAVYDRKAKIIEYHHPRDAERLKKMLNITLTQFMEELEKK